MAEQRKQIPRYKSTRNLDKFSTRLNHINFSSAPSPLDADDDHAYDSSSETPLIANGTLARKRKQPPRASATSSQSSASSVSSASDSRSQDPKVKLEKRRRRYIQHLGQQKDGEQDHQIGIQNNISHQPPSLDNDDDMEIDSGDEEELGSEAESLLSLDTQTESVNRFVRREDWHTTGFWDTGGQHQNTTESVPTNIITRTTRSLSQSNTPPSLQQDFASEGFPIFQDTTEEDTNESVATLYTPRELRPLLPSNPNTYRPKSGKENENSVPKLMRPSVEYNGTPGGRVGTAGMRPKNPFRTNPQGNALGVSACDFSFQERTPRTIASFRQSSCENHGLGTTPPLFESHGSYTTPDDTLRERNQDEKTTPKAMPPAEEYNRKPTGTEQVTPKNPSMTNPQGNTSGASAHDSSFQEGAPRVFASLRQTSRESHGLGTTPSLFRSHGSNTAQVDTHQEKGSQDEKTTQKFIPPPDEYNRKPTGTEQVTPKNPSMTNPPGNSAGVSAHDSSFQEGTPRAFAGLRQTGRGLLQSHGGKTALADTVPEGSQAEKPRFRDTNEEYHGKCDPHDSSGTRSSGSEKKEDARQSVITREAQETCTPRGSRNKEGAANNREGDYSDEEVVTAKKKHEEYPSSGAYSYSAEIEKPGEEKETGRLASSPERGNDAARAFVSFATNSTSHRERAPSTESISVSHGIREVEVPSNQTNQDQDHRLSESAMSFQSPDEEVRNEQDKTPHRTLGTPDKQPRIGNLHTSCVSRHVDFNRTIHPFTQQRPTMHRRSDLDSLRGQQERSNSWHQDEPVDWTAEEADERGVGGIQNEHQYFWLSNGKRFYRHQPLPPGWRVHVSKTNNVPYYTHPCFGISLFCPERLQRDADVRSRRYGLVFDNTPSIRSTTHAATATRLNSESHSQRYGLVFDNTPSIRLSTTEATESRFHVLGHQDGVDDSEQDTPEDLNEEPHYEDHSNHEHDGRGSGWSVPDTPVGAMSVTTDPHFSGYVEREAFSPGKADLDSTVEVNGLRLSPQSETVPPEQAKTDQTLFCGETPGSSSVSKNSSLSSRSSGNYSGSSSTVLSSPIQHSDSTTSCEPPTPIELRAQQESPIGALAVAREEVFSGSVSISQKSQANSPLVDDRYVEQAQSGFESTGSRKRRASPSRESPPGSSSSRSRDLSLESSTSSPQSNNEGDDDSFRSPIIRNDSPEGALRVACDAAFSGSIAERLSPTNDDRLVAQQKQLSATTTKKTAPESSQKKTPRLSARERKRSNTPVLPSPEDTMVPDDDAPMDNIELSPYGDDNNGVASDLQTSQIGRDARSSGLSPLELAAPQEELGKSTKKAAKKPQTQGIPSKRKSPDTGDTSGRSVRERQSSVVSSQEKLEKSTKTAAKTPRTQGKQTKARQREVRPTKKTEKGSSQKQTPRLSARQGKRSKTPVLPCPEDTMVPDDDAPMETIEQSHNSDDNSVSPVLHELSSLELATQRESTKKAPAKTSRNQGKRSRRSPGVSSSVLESSPDCSEADHTVAAPAHVSPPVVGVTQPARRRRKKRWFSERCYREPQDPLEWFWNHDLKHKPLRGAD